MENTNRWNFQSTGYLPSLDSSHMRQAYVRHLESEAFGRFQLLSYLRLY